MCIENNKKKNDPLWPAGHPHVHKPLLRVDNLNLNILFSRSEGNLKAVKQPRECNLLVDGLTLLFFQSRPTEVKHRRRREEGDDGDSAVARALGFNKVSL